MSSISPQMNCDAVKKAPKPTTSSLLLTRKPLMSSRSQHRSITSPTHAHLSLSRFHILVVHILLLVLYLLISFPPRYIRVHLSFISHRRQVQNDPHNQWHDKTQNTSTKERKSDDKRTSPLDKPLTTAYSRCPSQSLPYRIFHRLNPASYAIVARCAEF